MTHIIRVIEMAIKSLMLHKFRSFLSILGIIFGVMAVVAMLAIGAGAKQEAVRQIELLGTNNLIVRALALTDSQRIAAEERQSPGLTLNDAASLQQLPGVERVAALRTYLVDSVQGSEADKPAIVGVTPDYPEITNIRLAEGSFISDVHVEQRMRVCVLGGAAARAGRQYRASVGEDIRIGSEWFRVVGIFEDKDFAQTAEAAITPRNSNNDIYIPISVVPGNINIERDRVEEVWVQAADGEMVSALSHAVGETLRRTHRGVMDYEVLVPRELLQQKQATQRIFNLVLGTIASISLLVGGIGIMNIMLATVSERTREIGICRALGACRADIVIQFIAESVVLTAMGGLVGILFGWCAAWLIATHAGWPTAISWQSVAAAVVISTLIGVFFGLYPARRAASMDPITALRSE